jgi:NDP-sugar pyrophosphorylase family protein
MIKLQEFVQRAMSSPHSSWCDQPPWSIVANAQQIVHDMLAVLGDEFERRGTVAIHRTATIEAGAVVKGPAIIGAQCLIAAGSYLRGGAWLDELCVIGPGTELKSSFVFSGTRLAHFNFVGDTILGSDVNLEAGSVIANYRNERADKQIRVRIATELHATGVETFGALVGDRARIGANSVIAPGALIRPDEVVPRLSLVDQESD